MQALKTTEITSTQNPKIKHILALREKRQRDKSGEFLIEGYRELLRAVDFAKPIKSLFICPELFLGSNEEALILRIQKSGAQIFTCPKAVFSKISYRDRPDGLLAISKKDSLNLKDLEAILKQKKNPFLIIAEAVEKPGNLGTILRSSDAAGLDALIVCDACTDVHNPNVVRASVGTLFTVPVIEASSKETIEFLKKHGISVLAATPSACKNYTDVDMTRPLAIAVGTEQLGLSKQWMEQADIQVKIPMHGVADSLNVAMAATLLLYEVLRQRQ